MSELIKSSSTNEQIPIQENINIGYESYTPDEKQLLRMTSLIDILKSCEEAGVEPIVLGGYGLDGLYGKLTRDHDDIDMLVDDEKLENIAKVMNALGYQQDPDELDKAVFRSNTNDPEFKIEFIGVSALGRFSDKDVSFFIPNEHNATLNGRSFKALTLHGQREIIKIQNLRAGQKGWGQYSIDKRRNQAWLINTLKQKNVM